MDRLDRIEPRLRLINQRLDAIEATPALQYDLLVARFSAKIKQSIAEEEAAAFGKGSGFSLTPPNVVGDYPKGSIGVAEERPDRDDGKCPGKDDCSILSAAHRKWKEGSP